jgi:hypothetical protein
VAIWPIWVSNALNASVKELVKAVELLTGAATGTVGPTVGCTGVAVGSVGAVICVDVVPTGTVAPTCGVMGVPVLTGLVRGMVVGAPVDVVAIVVVVPVVVAPVVVVVVVVLVVVVVVSLPVVVTAVADVPDTVLFDVFVAIAKAPLICEDATCRALDSLFSADLRLETN